MIRDDDRSFSIGYTILIIIIWVVIGIGVAWAKDPTLDFFSVFWPFPSLVLYWTMYAVLSRDGSRELRKAERILLRRKNDLRLIKLNNELSGVEKEIDEALRLEPDLEEPFMGVVPKTVIIGGNDGRK